MAAADPRSQAPPEAPVAAPSLDALDPETAAQAQAEALDFLRLLEHMDRTQRIQAACMEQMHLRLRRLEADRGLDAPDPEFEGRMRELNRMLADLAPGRPAPDVPGTVAEAAAHRPATAPVAGNESPGPGGRRPLGPLS